MKYLKEMNEFNNDNLIDEVKSKLRNLLKNTKHISDIDSRVEQLIEIQHPYIDNVRGKLSSDEIAKSLFRYEKELFPQYHI